MATPLTTGYDVPIERHLSRATDHEPVLGAPRVLLVAQPQAWIHDDPLHLVIRDVAKDLVVTPRAVRLVSFHGRHSRRRVSKHGSAVQRLARRDS